ncbi:hypothetical protein GCM10022255_110730 [Dactylosporangium darangshiense]|uniref:Uncharacterized protein n=1 Tax=Dactylosporangium darangshiense TaxID=579108 RepID=A0ABP8DUY5_9ACTN
MRTSLATDIGPTISWWLRLVAVPGFGVLPAAVSGELAWVPLVLGVVRFNLREVVPALAQDVIPPSRHDQPG